MTRLVDSVVSQLSGAFRRGFGAASGLDRPGAEIKVEPFAPGTVTGPAIAAKALAALMAGRRGAANMRAKLEGQASTNRLRNAQIAQLEQKLTPQPTQEYNVAGHKVHLTDTQAAAHGRELTTGGVTPTKRVPLYSGYQKDVGKFTTYDPQTGTVAEPELQQYERATGRQGIIDRSNRNFDIRAHSLTLQRSEKALADLDTNEKQLADEFQSRWEPTVRQFATILQDPNSTPVQRAQAARRLNLPLVRTPAVFEKGTGKQKGGGEIQVDAQGRPMYDLSQLDRAVKEAVAQGRQWKLTQIQAMHSPERLFYSKLRRDAATGMVDTPMDDAPDRLDAALDQLGQIYGQGEQPPAANDPMYDQRPR